MFIAVSLQYEEFTFNAMSIIRDQSVKKTKKTQKAKMLV